VTERHCTALLKHKMDLHCFHSYNVKPLRIVCSRGKRNIALKPTKIQLSDDLPLADLNHRINKSFILH